MNNETFEKTILKKSYDLLADDCHTVWNILEGIRNPHLSNSLLPYLSLFCESAQEFPIISDCGYTCQQITELRNRLKFTQGKFKKTSAVLLNTDHRSDEEFKDEVCSPILIDTKSYDNLGISFDKNYNIVSNTQMLSYKNNIENLFSEDCGERCMALGFEVSFSVRKIFTRISEDYDLRVPLVLNKMPAIPYYLDLNTDRAMSLFKNKYGKDMNLLMLYMLSDLNFINKILLPILPEENLWGFRMKYISAHYAMLGFKQITSRLSSDDKFYDFSNKVAKLQSFVFKSEFRSCMVHYNLMWHDHSVIQQKGFDENTPFYGLIESCFEGLSFKKYSELLDQIIDCMIKALSLNFNVDPSQLKEYDT